MPIPGILALPAVEGLLADPEDSVSRAELLSRVFKVDVLKCENCGGRMTVLAFLTERAVVKKILEHLGLQAKGPPKAPARGAAQLESG